jgi:uncharacterized integral membrane protein
MKRLILSLVAVLLVVVVALQNTEEVSTRLLITDVRLPLAILLSTMAGLGFIAGIALTLWAKRKRRTDAKRA